ncbi:MAG: hypothetical protein QNK18_12490 [Gammaproteobacteria bacterium]|nr:hypothetical protein [Gammaproteobacteria bacterium]
MPRLVSRLVILTVLTGLSGASTLQARDFQDSQVMHMSYPAWFKDSLLDLQEDIIEARADGKLGLMVLFTTEGCSYCDVFIRRSLGDQRLASVLKNHFHSVGLEIFNDAEMVGPRGEALRGGATGCAGFQDTGAGTGWSSHHPGGLVRRDGLFPPARIALFRREGQGGIAHGRLVLRQRMMHSLGFTLERAY